MKRPNFALAPLPAALAGILALLATAPSLAGDCSVSSTPTSDFIINGDGTVTHKKTGLMWFRCADGLTGSDCSGGTAGTWNWNTVLQGVVGNNTNSRFGYNDWRLPNIAELRSLMDECRANPAINTTVFPGVTSNMAFWSSSPRRAYPSHSWYVKLSNGEATIGGQGAALQVLLVRGGGQPTDTFDLTKVYAPVGLTDFAAVASAAKGVQVMASDTKTLAGLTTLTGIKIAGNGSPQYQVNGGAWTSQPGLAYNGDKIKVRLTSAISDATAAVATLTAGGVAAQFSVTTAAAPPSAPANVAASAGNGAATVTWDDPNDSSITSYTVTASPGGATCTAYPPATSCTVPGLANGSAYTFVVTATNALGVSADSAPSPSTPLATLPTEPIGVSATPGNGTASVNWSVPANDGGSAIIGYVVTAYPGGATCTPVPATATTCDFTGLENDKTYTFTVKATNGVGTGAASDPSTPVTPASTAPGKPTGVTATPGSGSASVSWTAPADDGGGAITGYTVTANPGGQTCTAYPPATSCVVTGLTPGQNYTFSVTATNGKGTGIASDPSNGTTPTATEPGAPSGVAATPGDGEATISWAAAYSGGDPILAYTVTAQPGGATCTAVPPDTSCTITPLTNGTEYSFSVKATNGIGDGAPSVARTIVAGAPGKPGGVSATPGNGQASVSWTAPADNGSAITNYTVTAQPEGATCTAVPPATSCTVSGLDNGKAYTFTVTAANARGDGPASSASGGVTPSSGGGGSGGGGGGSTDTNLPTGGGSTSVQGSGQTIVVTNNGQEGSTITLGSSSQAGVVLPGSGRVDVQSANGSTLKVGNTQVGGKTVQVLAVASGSATVASTQAGQPTISAGGITVVSGQAGSNSTASVDPQGGVTVQVAPGDSVIVNPGVTSTNAHIDLSQGGTVQVQTGGETIDFTPAAGGAILAFNTVEVNGVPTPVPTVISGELQVSIPVSCTPMLSVNTTPISAGMDNSQAEAGEGGGLVTVTLTAGQGLIGLCTAGNRMAEAAKPVYTGESAEFTPDGSLQRIRLGSMHSDQGWTGDPLNLIGFGASIFKASVAGIDGTADRLQQNLMAALLSTVNQGTGNTWAYQSQGQSAVTGVWTLQAQTPTGTNDRLAVWPVGKVVVDENIDTVRTNGNGMVQVRTGNLLAGFAPALADPQGFAAEVAKSGAGELVFQPDGTLHAVFGNQIYVVQPDWQVLPGTTQGFAVDALGRITWTDSNGNSQVLDPAFADLSQLIATFQKDDPAFAFHYAWRGEVSVVYQGIPMILVPDNLMTLTPQAHRQEAWWIEGGKAYLRYPDYHYSGWTDFCQGFSVKLAE